jgi:hypothetical protein
VAAGRLPVRIAEWLVPAQDAVRARSGERRDLPAPTFLAFWAFVFSAVSAHWSR